MVNLFYLKIRAVFILEGANYSLPVADSSNDSLKKYNSVTSRTRCQGPDAGVQLVSWGNTAKIAQVLVTATPVCMEHSAWRRMEGRLPATVPWDIQESSVRLDNFHGFML